MRECSPPQTCYVSHVMCHVSCVTCHVSRVTCHMSLFFFFFFFFGQSGEAYRWRVCYQRGLPRLVFLIWDTLFSNIPPTNTTSSSSTIRTTSTTIILITNMRSTDLHPCIYSRLLLFQITTAASGTEAEGICLFRTSLRFRVV